MSTTNLLCCGLKVEERFAVWAEVKGFFSRFGDFHIFIGECGREDQAINGSDFF